ncbi:F-box protein [Trifolium repens]|nr:F-box protein [Trifolium repens]
MMAVEMGSDENQDFISALPNEVLTFILSKLHVDEAMRCNIISKRQLGPQPSFAPLSKDLLQKTESCERRGSVLG